MSVDETPKPTVLVGSRQAAHIGAFRNHRPDVRAVHHLSSWTGICWEYQVPQSLLQSASSDDHTIEVRVDEDTVLTVKGARFSQADYWQLLVTETTWGRDDIYTSANRPPSDVSEHIVDFVTEHACGTVLDFGCGSGVLVRELCVRGVNARGIDLNIDWIRNHLLEEISPRIELYDGSLPLPFDDNVFDTVVATEVIEHLENCNSVVRELQRVSRKNVIITVPNLNAIPILFEHYVVPWHLLEADHRGFFSQSALNCVLAPLFDRVDFFQFHERSTNGTAWFANIGAVCWQ